MSETPAAATSEDSKDKSQLRQKRMIADHFENLARAKQTLPNGYCGLPLQQSCPHPNACLTCNHFLTTPEFLDQHREQLQRTEQLIIQAQADGRQRLAEMNEPIRLNLIRVIDSLEDLDDPDAA